MGTLLEVKEFETIIGNKEYAAQYKCIDQDTLHNLIAFMHEYDVTNEEADILNFVKIGYKRNLGETITFQNYVGIIQMKNHYQIQILPKIEFGNDEKDETKKVFMKMLKSMKDFQGKVFSNTNLNLDKMNLFEVFINMYLQEVRQLVRYGIRSDYINQKENQNIFKGKLLVSEQLKNNIAHKERFYVSFDEFNANRPENRLIKSTLLKLQNISGSATNKKEIRQLLVSFELVEPSKNYDKDFSKIVIDRSTKQYKNTLQWSEVFLKNKSFTTFSGKNNARALLFPMEKVFEAYVAQNMKKIFSQRQWEVSVQDKGHYLFNKLNGELHHKFALRPDIVVTRDDGSRIIFDTKWKKLINNKNKNYGISQADMYQMYAYGKKYNTSEVWLLYPINSLMKNHEVISFDSGDGVNVSVFFVDVVQIEDSLNKLLNLFSE